MTQDFAVARTNMVENQVRTNDVTDLAVQDAMRVVPRERLCGPKAALAYAEAPVAYAPGYALAEPRTVAKLLQAISPQPGERALAVAAPYAALVLAQVGCKTDALQPPGVPSEAVASALADAGVTLTSGELTEVSAGPFDVIVCEGGVERAPKAWTDALAIGGRLGVVERSGPGGRARLYVRAEDGGLARRDIFDAAPEMMPGFGPKPVFAL